MLTFERKVKQGFKTFAIVRGFEDVFAQCFRCTIFNDLQLYLQSVCVGTSFAPATNYVSTYIMGNQHLNSKEVAVCDCESLAVTLVCCQFWLGSPERPSAGFHF